ncbi:MAG: hypothetical protein IJ809_02270 [Clostridia bacterium]|nr:hypothetical protein [Clostridia bacterium]
MKSRIYSNFDVKIKFGGIVDYKSIAIFVFIIFIIFSLSNYLNLDFKITFILICLSLPLGSVLIFCNTKTESSIDIIKNVVVFFLTSKVYVKGYNEIKKQKCNLANIYVKKGYIVDSKKMNNGNRLTHGILWLKLNEILKIGRNSK